MLAALDNADLPEDDKNRLRAMLTNPAHQFGLLPIEEQKERTAAAAEQAAEEFIALAQTGHVGDPMHAFWDLKWLSHNRDLAHFAATIILADVLDEEDARAFALMAWTSPEWPEANLGGDLWRLLWQQVGYVSDGDPRPTGPVTLYRGAVPARKRGMAWTADLTRARWFAHRFPRSEHFKQGRVYTASVAPERIYARYTGRGEDEWVIDTRGLGIRTLETK
jgi:hypothetical protein